MCGRLVQGHQLGVEGDMPKRCMIHETTMRTTQKVMASIKDDLAYEARLHLLGVLFFQVSNAIESCLVEHRHDWFQRLYKQPSRN
jgi:hypothetical protein